MPELQSLEAQAALDVPLMSQDPPEVEQVIEEAYQHQETEQGTKIRKRSRKGARGGDEAAAASQELSLPLMTGGMELSSSSETLSLCPRNTSYMIMLILYLHLPSPGPHSNFNLDRKTFRLACRCKLFLMLSTPHTLPLNLSFQILILFQSRLPSYRWSSVTGHLT